MSRKVNHQSEKILEQVSVQVPSEHDRRFVHTAIINKKIEPDHRVDVVIKYIATPYNFLPG